jgi:hypothetical protein
VSALDLLAETRREIEVVGHQISALEAILRHSPRLHTLLQERLHNRAYKLLALMNRERALETWSITRAQLAGLPWVGTEVQIRKPTLETCVVWALHDPGNEVFFESDVPGFTVLRQQPQSVKYESDLYFAKDRGFTWNLP